MAAAAAASSCSLVDDVVIRGPWRATRLWNEIVRMFQHGMPLKKHRKSMKSFDNCFSGSEAADWLHKYLKKNPNFGSDVTREQTLQLLEKLKKAGVIRIIWPIENSGTREIQIGTFRDNSDLYTFPNDIERVHRELLSGNLGLKTPKTPIKLLKSPGSALKISSLLTRNSSSGSALGEINGNTPRRRRTKSSNETRFYTNMNADNFKDLSGNCSSIKAEEDGGDTTSLTTMNTTNTDIDKRSLNFSYFQTLPTNSLILLDNDETWKMSYENQLKPLLTQAHINSLQINVSYITYNMTKVSAKGVVQLTDKKSDLPHWVLSAMKCLANWPKPLKNSNQDLPNYAGFENDVFAVVKEYFLNLKMPLTTYGLFDFFISSYLKAEAYRGQNNRSTPIASSTMTNSCFDRYARIRKPKIPSNSSTMNETLNSNSEGHSLPPNTCFETAFMHESPITRIVKQKDSETLNFGSSNNRRLSCYSSISTSLDTSRSLGTQTEKEDLPKRSRQPKWRRSSRSRKSIAVMDHKSCATDVEDSEDVNKKPFYSTKNLRGYNSMDNLVDGNDNDKFLEKYHRLSDRNYIIPSKTVRKQKHKSYLRQSNENLEDRVAYPSGGYYNPTCYDSRLDLDDNNVVYATSTYQHLTVKTPMYPNYATLGGGESRIKSTNKVPLGPQSADSILCQQQQRQLQQQQQQKERQSKSDGLSPQGVNSAIHCFKLIALLIPPANRRKLQLLLKFMKRISVNHTLKLSKTQTTLDFVLDLFSEVILKPLDYNSYDEDLNKKIIRFFIDHYEEIWTPPESLRREVEERVYQSLVSRRIEAGEDPYPITFCQRIPSKLYEKSKITGAQSALLYLLSHILFDPKMSVKDKKRKVRKFKESYPEIYQMKFPSKDSEPDYMKELSSEKEHSVGRFSSLTRLKNAMRI